eukprot:Rhum_TRINITY_DN2394_c0_g1::Rhum_TRINITY_DN2394_c0_g1_i1::g.7029::m.7029
MKKNVTGGSPKSVLLHTAFVTLVNFVSYSAWTLLNKLQFKRYDVSFPVFVASYQMFFVGLVCFLYLSYHGRVKKPTKAILTRIVPLGIVRSSDIGFGNAALRLLSVALQQIIKSTIPVYVCLLSSVVLRKRVSGRVWCTLVPIIGGVVMASWGELSASSIGVFMAVLSCVARAGKAIINDLLLHAQSDDERLDTVQIMMFESPLSGVILALCCLLFESGSIYTWMMRDDRVPFMTVIVYNSFCGVLMLLNQWSYISIIKYTSSVTCQILMNLKMVTLILVSVTLFGTPLHPIHYLGMAIATGGCTTYAFVKQAEDQPQPLEQPAVAPSYVSPTKNESFRGSESSSTAAVPRRLDQV